VEKTWGEIKQLSKIRVRWPQFPNVLFSNGSQRTMMVMMMMMLMMICLMHVSKYFDGKQIELEIIEGVVGF
jgi:hypothetical protein